jgi:hypothetical protein
MCVWKNTHKTEKDKNKGETRGIRNLENASSSSFLLPPSLPPSLLTLPLTGLAGMLALAKIKSPLGGEDELLLFFVVDTYGKRGKGREGGGEGERDVRGCLLL